MVKLSKLLQNKEFENIKYLTSNKIPDKLVRDITVMEVPEVSKWLTGNELVITSLYSVKNSIEAQINLIKELKGVNCSGLLIKLGPHVEKLDEKIINIAEELEIPILLIPKNMTYVEILGTGIRLLYKEEEEAFCIENILRKLLINETIDEYEINELKRHFEVNDLKDLYYFNILSTSDTCIHELNYISPTYKSHYSKYFINTLISKNQKDLMLYGEDIEEYISNTKNCVFLIGDVKKNILDFWNDFDELYNIFDEYNNIKKEEVYLFNKEDIESYIYEYKLYMTKGKKNFLNYLNNLNEEEIITISVYIKNNFNVIETSKELFLHKNTVRYRLSSIEEKTNLNLSNFYNLINLFYGLKYLEVSKDK